MIQVSVSSLISVGAGYLVLLFLAAWLVDQGWIPSRWVRHPATYVLSLGVYASAWAIYGVVGFAHEHGYNYLAYYLGISGIFFLAPLLLAPIMRLSQTYQLASLADLFAFRYRSRLVGALVTLIMLFGMMPLLALQIEAVADSVRILTGITDTRLIAILFCATLVVFTIVFGARHATTRTKHEGLVFAMAIESVMKLIVMLGLAAYGLFSVFGGPGNLQIWLAENPVVIEELYAPLNSGTWHSLIGAFFFSAIVMPHMFHMAFTETLNPRALITASWSVPLMFLLMAVTVPLILWSAYRVGVGISPEFFSLGLPMASGSASMALLVFVGGLSAASGIIIISTLALSAMCVNHLLLPAFNPRDQDNIYGWLLWNRRAAIFVVIAVAFVFYELLNAQTSQTDLGMISFIAALQFVPGLIGVLFWPRATRGGLLAGLATGLGIWAMALFAQGEDWLVVPLGLANIAESTQNEQWMVYGLTSNLANAIAFVLVSLLTRMSAAEQQAADSCAVDNLRRPFRWELKVSSAEDFIVALAPALGLTSARREVEIALNDLQLTVNEMRPYALRRLRDQLESNLSGLLGPSRAHEIIDERLPFNIHQGARGTEDIQFIESRLETYHTRLSGLAAELDSLRRFHRQTLYDLPLGVCSLSEQKEILSWNREMERITDIPGSQVIGSYLNSLPSPWHELLDDFLANGPSRVYSQQIEIDAETHWINLHKSAPNHDRLWHLQGGTVIVVEDLSDLKRLENQLAHHERLASVGRLAAGVAHEIGNPVTGIACLAQDLRFARDNDEVGDISRQILEQTERINHIVRSLMGYSHVGNAAAHDAVNVFEAVQEAIHLMRLDKHSKPVNYVNRCDHQHTVSGNSQRLMQVFINLLSNARDASDDQGEISVTSEAQDGKILIHFTDDGHGIDPGISENLVEPFVTTKAPGKGTGLGLSLVYSILQEHFGSMTFTSPWDTARKRGTRVTIELPEFVEGQE